MSKENDNKDAEENVTNENVGNSENSNSTSNTNANNTNSSGCGNANASNTGNNGNSDSDKFFDVTLSRLLEHIRDFREVEISNQWQRSVMLGVFIVLVWTGIFSVLGDNFCKKCFLSYNSQCYVLLVLLSIIGVVFSSLWVFMAKGSKYWYEYYEGRMKTLNKYLCYSLKESQKYFPKDAFNVMEDSCTKCSNCENISTKNKDADRLFELQDMLYGIERETNEGFCFCTNKGQRCSLSTINYCIGMINFVLFNFVFVVFASLLLYKIAMFFLKSTIQSNVICSVVLWVSVILISVIFCFCFGKLLIKKMEQKLKRPKPKSVE